MSANGKRETARVAAERRRELEAAQRGRALMAYHRRLALEQTGRRS